jgi:polyribonucleotide nucleotidyltransferase
MVAASAALTTSDIPFFGPIGAVRIGRIGGKLVLNPPLSDWPKSDLNIVLAGTESAVMMVESESKEISEEEMLDALAFGHAGLQPLIALQKALAEKIGRAKRDAPAPARNEAVSEAVKKQFAMPVQEALLIAKKEARQAQLDSILAQAIETVKVEGSDVSTEVTQTFHDLEYTQMRQLILQKGIRADGRSVTEIRPISCEVGLLPRTHGSALFTRGETQSLTVATLGTSDDEQRLDPIEGDTRKSFLLHYNFPAFSVGEVKPNRGPGRREIGHGALAERALKQVMPTPEAFPYTVRVVSEILESNGSSSMATVCAGTLAMMDAGVPITRPVAGIAMGLVREGGQFQVLSDILGMEDNLGDMDFKVAGTAQGITALQMDIKIGGLSFDIIKAALAAAKTGRAHIMDRMLATLAASRPEISSFAPRITTLHVKKDKLREVIGQGGKVVRGIIEATGVKIDIRDDGTIHVASANQEASQKAVDMIKAIVEEVEIGRVYLGKVTRIMDFGAFVEIKRGVEGLVHISQLASHRVQKVGDEVSEGEEIMVKVVEVDRQGKIRLSRKDALPAGE